MTDPGVATTEVVHALTSRGETVATAESLTGGLVTAALTAVPGASACVVGGVTAYATPLKARLLDVSAERLAEVGPVDEDVARQMAAGVRTLMGSDWGVATTGVAGPSWQGGQPPGTVFIAVSGPSGEQVRRLALTGDRTQIRAETVAAVVGLLLAALRTP